MSIFDDIDHVIKVLDDKIVRTSQGSFIKVDDLREFQRQVRESRQAEQSVPRPKTFHAARELAKRDPRFAQQPRPPQPPAFASVKGVGGEDVAA